jgi:hypothetical protein
MAELERNRQPDQQTGDHRCSGDPGEMDRCGWGDGLKGQRHRPQEGGGRQQVVAGGFQHLEGHCAHESQQDRGHAHRHRMHPLRGDQHLGNHPDWRHRDQVKCGQNHAGGLPAESGDGELVDGPVQVGILVRLVGGGGVILVEPGCIGDPAQVDVVVERIPAQAQMAEIQRNRNENQPEHDQHERQFEPFE